MTDLHTHILPEMDDGAADLEAALILLTMQANQGVERIALTSHYNCDEQTPEEFLQRRAASWEKLKTAAEAAGLVHILTKQRKRGITMQVKYRKFH